MRNNAPITKRTPSAVSDISLPFNGDLHFAFPVAELNALLREVSRLSVSGNVTAATTSGRLTTHSPPGAALKKSPGNGTSARRSGACPRPSYSCSLRRVRYLAAFSERRGDRQWSIWEGRRRYR